jgi:hypothetical protein
MPIDNFEIVGSYDNQRFPNIDSARTINMFEYSDPLGKKPKTLISTSGLLNTGLEFPNTAPTDGFRMEYVLNGFEYFVVGNNFYRRDSLNNLVQLNNTLTQPILGSGYVGVDANNAATGPQILFVDGQKGHIYDTGSGIFTYDVHAVDPAFPTVPLDVTFLDGYLVVIEGGTNTFELSALNNVYSWGLVSNTFTADDTAGNNWLIVSSFIPTGTEFQIATTGGAPNPLVVATSYYAINVDATHIRVASSYANAILGTAITLTSNGSPTNTITNAGINSSPTQAFAPGQLQLGAINSHPGNIVACRTLHRRLFLFSSNFTEIWENSGAGTNLPFRRTNSLLMEYGTPSIGSISTGFDKMIFLSQDRDGLGSVMEVDGTSATPISNRALDFQLAQYAQLGQVSDSRGILIKENGIIFYRLNFTAANHTFVYNVTLSSPQTEEGKFWHEEQVLNGDRHPAQTHGYFNGNNYYGSYNSPILYQVDQSFVTNDGEIIARIRIGRPLYGPKAYNRTRIDRFMVDVIQGQTNLTNISGILYLLTESGNNIDTENGLDLLLDESTTSGLYNTSPLPIFLSYSKDGGVTYGYRQTAYIGAMGNRTARTVWRKLGVVPRGQAFVPKIEFYGNVPLTIMGAAWFYEVMPE